MYSGPLDKTYCMMASHSNLTTTNHSTLKEYWPQHILKRYPSIIENSKANMNIYYLICTTIKL